MYRQHDLSTAPWEEANMSVSTWDPPVVFNFPISRFVLTFNIFWQFFKMYYQYFDLNWIDWPLIRSNVTRIGRKYQLYSGRISVKFSKTLVWILDQSGTDFLVRLVFEVNGFCMTLDQIWLCVNHSSTEQMRKFENNQKSVSDTNSLKFSEKILFFSSSYI